MYANLCAYLIISYTLTSRHTIIKCVMLKHGLLKVNKLNVREICFIATYLLKFLEHICNPIRGRWPTLYDPSPSIFANKPSFTLWHIMISTLAYSGMEPITDPKVIYYQLSQHPKYFPWKLKKTLPKNITSTLTRSRRGGGACHTLMCRGTSVQLTPFWHFSLGPYRPLECLPITRGYLAPILYPIWSYWPPLSVCPAIIGSKMVWFFTKVSVIWPIYQPLLSKGGKGIPPPPPTRGSDTPS